jgi:hypothetical protein
MTPHFRKALWTSLLMPWILGAGCSVTEVCDDGRDNDDDGLADCDDGDCSYNPYGYCEATEQACSGGDDEDDDGATDCEDEDCYDAPECEVGAGGLGGDSSSGGASSGGASSGGASSGGSTGGNNESGAAGEGGAGGSTTCPSPAQAQAGAGYISLGALGDFSDFTESSCQADDGGADIPLFYIAPRDGTLRVQSYSTNANADLSVRSDCGDPDSELPLACAADTPSGQQETLEVSVVAEQVIYIIVSGASAAAEDTAYLQLVLE